MTATGPASRAHLGRQLAIAGLCYLAVSLLIWARVWVTGSPSHALTCPCGDVAEQLWWFEWLPQAIAHAHNPFYSNQMFARLGGVNAMANTSWFLPALVLSPVTRIFGPVASYNLANLLAPVATGLAAFALAARFARLAVARLLAGLCFAFSPFVMGNVDLGHVNLTMLAYPALVLLVGDRLLRGETSPRRAGALLGALTVAEAFIGIEVVVITAMLVACCVLALAIVRPAVLTARLGGVAVAGGIAATICAVALAYPAYMFFLGPQHVTGPFWPSTSGVAPSRFFFPAALARTPIATLKIVGYEGARGTGTAYLGIGIFCVVILGFWVARARRLYAMLAIASLGCLVLEMDPLRGAHDVPLLNDIVHVRFSIGTTLLFAVMLAMVLDGWWRPTRAAPSALRARRGARASGAAAALCAAVVVVPVALSYSVPFVVSTTPVPRWYAHAGAHVPAGTAVLVFPFAWLTGDRAMAWQAESGDRFALVGGFGFVPGADGRHDEMVSPPAVPGLLVRLSAGRRLTEPQQARLRAALASWAPLRVVALDGQVRPGTVASLTALLGAPTSTAGGATTWVLGRGASLGAAP